MRVFAILLLSALSACAQGVLAEWDVKSYMTGLAADVRKLDPLLKRAAPADWIAKGAPDVYVTQLQSAQASLVLLASAADKLAGNPEKLDAAFEAYFQMERMEMLLASLREGIRRYQDQDLADALNRTYSGNVVHRDRLRQHIRDVTRIREQEFEIINEEAQRCRGMISRQPPPVPERKPARRKPAGGQGTK